MGKGSGERHQERRWAAPSPRAPSTAETCQPAPRRPPPPLPAAQERSDPLWNLSALPASFLPSLAHQHFSSESPWKSRRHRPPWGTVRPPRGPVCSRWPDAQVCVHMPMNRCDLRCVGRHPETRTGQEAQWGPGPQAGKPGVLVGQQDAWGATAGEHGRRRRGPFTRFWDASEAPPGGQSAAGSCPWRRPAVKTVSSYPSAKALKSAPYEAVGDRGEELAPQKAGRLSCPAQDVSQGGEAHRQPELPHSGPPPSVLTPSETVAA